MLINSAPKYPYSRPTPTCLTPISTVHGGWGVDDTSLIHSIPGFDRERVREMKGKVCACAVWSVYVCTVYCIVLYCVLYTVYNQLLRTETETNSNSNSNPSQSILFVCACV